MASGLESIALAVAHLESVQQKDSFTDSNSNSNSRRSSGNTTPTLLKTSSAPPPATATSASEPTPLSPPTLSAASSGDASHASVPPVRFGGGRQPRVISAEMIPHAQPPVVVPRTIQQPMSSRRLPSKGPQKALRNLDTVFEPADLADAPPVPDGVYRRVEDDDVMLGRGGESNHHTGNIQYRLLVRSCQPAYLRAKRRDKPRIAAGIVLAVRKIGGRFLKKDSQGNWRDVGNNRAREKTSQALREGAPELRNSIQNNSNNDNSSSNNNNTAPAPSTMMPSTAPHTLAPPGACPVLLLPKHHSVVPPPAPHAPLSIPAHLGGSHYHHHPLQHHVNHHHLPPRPPPPPVVAPPAKKRRTSLDHLAEAAALRPGNCSSTGTGRKRNPLPLAAVPAPAVVAPSVSSGDDEDEDDLSLNSVGQPKKQKRGPRIKLLKQRLESTA